MRPFPWRRRIRAKGDHRRGETGEVRRDFVGHPIGAETVEPAVAEDTGGDDNEIDNAYPLCRRLG